MVVVLYAQLGGTLACRASQADNGGWWEEGLEEEEEKLGEGGGKE